jgi:hypothetical protein
MPLSLSQIAANTASVTFPYAGESITVTYFPARVTEKTIAQMQAFVNSNEANIGSGFAAFNDILTHLIKSWDVYEDEEMAVMYPLEVERLAELPIAFRMKVLEAIMGDISPEAIASQEIALNGSH